MKRRMEHLVEKRDGRREFLRATKLARSVHLALFEIGVDEDWRALELATVVLEGLRQKRAAKSDKVASSTGQVVLTTGEIADAVQHLLVVTGQPSAAVAYGAVQAERSRRRQLVGVGVTHRASTNNPHPGEAQFESISNPSPISAGKPHSKPNERLGSVWGEG